eukprot:CAMPEP_0202352162 /NCGR_PEP_ID=MMETSP1126-20121109/8475_1 /ASSEMBLY_ACC=CAM_ASM_000457 /TAXON_ID=3047 /ORGANISM="Dunaliella tertiolecta, Strain CCMP1320" /LENGTH=184 /DNA_ID=CAMNT_0048944339 /DNA_START=1059 /DNA_END=1613 /DNA_ORIENTATION=+
MVSAVLWQPCIKLPALLEARPLERAAALPCSAQRVDRKGAGAQSPPPLFWTASVQTAAASAPAKAAPAAAGFLPCHLDPLLWAPVQGTKKRCGWDGSCQVSPQMHTVPAGHAGAGAGGAAADVHPPRPNPQVRKVPAGHADAGASGAVAGMHPAHPYPLLLYRPTRNAHSGLHALERSRRQPGL